MEIIGKFSKAVIDALSLNIPEGTPIYIGEDNEKHIKNRHPYEYELYYPRINEIIETPDYARFDEKHSSIDFVKTYEANGNNVQVSVRITSNGRYIARTLFLLMTYKVERFLNNGSLKKI